MKSARVLLIAGVLVLMPLTVFLALNRTSFFDKAASPGDSTEVATIALAPKTQTTKVGEQISYDIVVNTHGRSASIVQARLKYSYTGDKPPITVVDSQGDTTDQIQIQPGDISELNFVTNDVTDNPIPGTDDHEVIIRLTAVPADSAKPFSTDTDVILGTVTLKAETSISDFSLEFDPDETKITAFSDGKDVLLLPSDATLIIEGEKVAPSPKIVSVYPLTGKAGDVVVIEGENFGADQNDSYVQFWETRVGNNGVQSWSDKSLTVIVPEGAKSGKLTITTSGGSGGSPDIFEVAGSSLASSPFIESVSPSQVKEAESITIIGRNFGSSQSTSKVQIGQVPITTFTTWSNVLIEAKVPSGATTDQVKLVNEEGEAFSSTCLVITGTVSSNSTCLSVAFTTIGVGVTDVTNTSAEVTWVTDIESTSQVRYGFTNAYTKTSEKKNITDKVTSHALEISSLSPCATYHFQTISEADGAKVSVSEDQSFNTLGCPTDATVIQQVSTKLSPDVGGIVQLTDSGESLKIDAPAAYVDEESTLQIKKLNSEETFEDLALPSGFEGVGGNVYELNAYGGQDIKLTEFDEDVTVSISYSSADAAIFDEDSFSMRRWNGTAWEELTDCVMDKTARVVSCPVAHFSAYALMGETLSGDSPTTSSDQSDLLADTGETGTTGVGSTVPTTDLNSALQASPLVTGGVGSTIPSSVLMQEDVSSTPQLTNITTGENDLLRLMLFAGLACVIMGFALPFTMRVLEGSPPNEL